MPNESEVVITPTETSNDSEFTKVEETIEESSAEKEVVIETPEAKRARLERQLSQHNKKFGFEREEKSTPKAKKGEKSDEFDEGQLAYLLAKGIEVDEDIDFTKAELAKHGGSLRELLGNEYFKSGLKTRQEARTVLDATPKGNKRGNSSPNDTVDYHYAKYMQSGKLPTDPEMREKVVLMREKKETTGRQFTDNPVIGG